MITNYTPKTYFQDNINDAVWGCGWRCIQMLLSQFGVDKDIFTIAKEVQDLLGENVGIDTENQRIHMADLSWIMLYVSSQYQQMGIESNIDMLTIENISMINSLYEKLQNHFITQSTLVGVTAGGATALIAGVRQCDNLFEVYLIDPHVDSLEQNFEVLQGFGKGGRGWINIRDVILKGKDEIGIVDDNEFLMNSSCLFGFIILS
jgi:hypothetical protein